MDRAIKFIGIVFKNEGLYSNDPTDKGGETVYGIARNMHPRWGGWMIVDSLKKQKGFPHNLLSSDDLIILKNEFYKTTFFDPVRAGEINDELLALQVFDFGVNAGLSTSIKTLQKTAGVNDDGVFGSKTLEAVNKGNLSSAFIESRKTYYQRIADISLANYESKLGRKATLAEKMTKTNYKYLKGWLNRVDETTQAI